MLGVELLHAIHTLFAHELHATLYYLHTNCRPLSINDIHGLHTELYLFFTLGCAPATAVRVESPKQYIRGRKIGEIIYSALSAIEEQTSLPTYSSLSYEIEDG